MDNGYPMTVRRSKRRTLSVEITPQATVVVRAPYGMPNAKIRQFLTERSGWIEKHIEKMRAALAERPPVEPLSYRQLKELAEQALTVIPPKVAGYAEILGVDYGRITVRNQKTRWGSCSGKGNLNFNCLLMLAPEDVLDYVIVHELAHRKEMNHSRRFWNIVAEVVPDYKEKIRWLNVHGAVLMERMTYDFSRICKGIEKTD